VKLSPGAVVAADVKLVEGSILLDQSNAHGRIRPDPKLDRAANLCGALVRRGEGPAIVTATGARTKLDVLRNLSGPLVSRAPAKTVVRGARNLEMA